MVTNSVSVTSSRVTVLVSVSYSVEVGKSFDGSSSWTTSGFGIVLFGMSGKTSYTAGSVTLSS